MATASAISLDPLQRNATTPSGTGMRWRNEEPTLTLKLDLSDLPIPEVHNLQVEGLQKPWWQRLFSR